MPAQHPVQAFLVQTVSPATCGEEEEQVKLSMRRTLSGLAVATAFMAGGLAMAAPASAADVYNVANTAVVQATQAVQAATQAVQNSAVGAVQQAVQSVQQCLLTGVRKGCEDDALTAAFSRMQGVAIDADFYRFAAGKLLALNDGYGALVNTVQTALNKLANKTYDWQAFTPFGSADGWASDKLVGKLLATAKPEPFISLGAQQSLNSLAAMVG